MKHAPRPPAKREEASCFRHGKTPHALYAKANGNGSEGWRCLKCRAEASNRVYHRRVGKKAA